MKKVLFIVLLFLNVAVGSGQVFPVLNTATSKQEFTTAVSYLSYVGDRSIFTSYDVALWMDGSKYRDFLWDEDYGPLVSFRYVTKSITSGSEQWNGGSEATQLVFHPGGLEEKYDEYNPTKSPIYGFVCSEKYGLCLIDLNNHQDYYGVGNPSIIMKLGDSGDPRNYAYLTVFAGTKTSEGDIIVVSGKVGTAIYRIPNSPNGVRQISSSDKDPSYFGINGQKYDDPQPGLNIVVGGDKTKKIVVK